MTFLGGALAAWLVVYIIGKAYEAGKAEGRR